MKDRESVTTNGRAVFYAAMWGDLRQSALNNGWALALHGSLANDMDIMAMPWTENAKPVWDMILALKKCFDRPKEINVSETDMPNNRRVFTLSIWSDFYLDINIIEPIPHKCWCDCKEPKKIFTVFGIPDLCDYCRKNIYNDKHYES